MPDMQNEERWLIEWFRDQSPEAGSTPDADLAVADYFAMKLVDSFGVISLISDAEAAFNVYFTDEDFQDRRFSTIHGLADIIRGRRAG